MSSPAYYNEYDSDFEQFDIDQDTYEECEPYMTYDEEMAEFEDSENFIFEDDYIDVDDYNN